MASNEYTPLHIKPDRTTSPITAAAIVIYEEGRSRHLRGRWPLLSLETGSPPPAPCPCVLLDRRNVPSITHIHAVWPPLDTKPNRRRRALTRQRNHHAATAQERLKKRCTSAARHFFFFFFFLTPMTYPYPHRYTSQQQLHSPPPSYHSASGMPNNEYTPLYTKPDRPTSPWRVVVPAIVGMVTLTVCTIIVLCNAHSAAPPKPQPKPPIQSPPRVPVEPLPSFPDKLPPVEPDMYWVLPLVPDTYCMGYGTRAYTAELYIEAVAMQDWHRICVEGAPEVEVSGKIAKRPAWCDRDEDDAVIGHWVVDHDEPECISSWGRVDDKGCTSDASGMRKYEARLFGRLEGGAWRDMCRRTPAIVHGKKFPGAMRCADRERDGKWGAWDLEDETCA